MGPPKTVMRRGGIFLLRMKGGGGGGVQVENEGRRDDRKEPPVDASLHFQPYRAVRANFPPKGTLQHHTVKIWILHLIRTNDFLDIYQGRDVSANTHVPV